MFFAVCQAAEILAATGEPANFLFGTFSAEITSCGSNFSVLHQFFLRRKFFRDELGIAIKDNIDFFPAVLRTAKIINRVKAVKRFIWDKF